MSISPSSTRQLPDPTDTQLPLRPLLLKIPAAAEQLGISRSKLYNLINGGAIPTKHIGRGVFVTAEALEAFVAAL